MGEYLPSGRRSTIPLASRSVRVRSSVSTSSPSRAASSSGRAGEASRAAATRPARALGGGPRQGRGVEVERERDLERALVGDDPRPLGGEPVGPRRGGREDRAGYGIDRPAELDRGLRGRHRARSKPRFRHDEHARERGDDDVSLGKRPPPRPRAPALERDHRPARGERRLEDVPGGGGVDDVRPAARHDDRAPARRDGGEPRGAVAPHGPSRDDGDAVAGGDAGRHLRHREPVGASPAARR